MSLYRDGIVDPIAAAGGRQLDYLPPHFSCIKLPDYFWDTSVIRNWIWTNLSGRFMVGYRHSIQNSVDANLVAAFEDPSEATLFALMLPAIQQIENDDWLS